MVMRQIKTRNNSTVKKQVKWGDDRTVILYFNSSLLVLDVQYKGWSKFNFHMQKGIVVKKN